MLNFPPDMGPLCCCCCFVLSQETMSMKREWQLTNLSLNSQFKLQGMKIQSIKTGWIIKICNKRRKNVDDGKFTTKK